MMVSQKVIEDQLKQIGFNPKGWNTGEVGELHNILLPDEIIYECANGWYEGGFALVVATDVRILLIDKKIMGYLNVEDFRFDMISEIDYNHRFVGANLRLSSGSKTLNFRSYDKERLRKLVGHIQHLMADGKKKQSSNAEGQHQHLEEINQKLQDYLVTQYKQQQRMQKQLEKLAEGNEKVKAEVPKNEEQMPEDLKNYLYAQGILQKYQEESGKDLKSLPETTSTVKQIEESKPLAALPAPETPPPLTAKADPVAAVPSDDIYSEGVKEVFGKQQTNHGILGFEVNPLKAIYKILPIEMVNRARTTATAKR